MLKKSATNDELVARAIAVAAELDGSCRSLEQAATEEELNSQVFCQALDARVMLCEECGWWSPTCEMVNDDFPTCAECARESRDAEETDD